VTRTGSDALVDALQDAGIEMFFGLPGESTLPLYAAVRRSDVRHVMARSETAAGYMADAYARFTGKVAVTDAPGGIGSPLLLPALHEAYNSSIPLVALTSGVPADQEGRWPTAACRHQEMFRPAVKATIAVPDAAHLPALAGHAVRLAIQGRPGPVHLDVPSDLLAEPCDPQATAGQATIAPSAPSRIHPDPQALAETAELLITAQRPLLVAGGGVQLAGAYNQLTAFTDAFRIPVATTFNGKGSLAETHPCSLGVIGAKGSTAANDIAARADMVVWIGSKAGDKSTDFGRLPGPGAVCIQVEGTPNWTGTTGALLDPPQDNVVPAPGNLVQAMMRACPADTGVIADASRACSWVGAHFRCRLAGRSVIAPRGSGSIGYALPAAIGASLAQPERTMIGVGGDGGFALACQGMETAIRAGARLIFVLLNDNEFGLLNRVASVGLQQPDLIEHFAPTDWTAVAHGFGWHAHTVQDNTSFERAFTVGLDADTPTLINVLLSPDIASPDFQMYAERQAGRR
jgi:acetolactate synthase I/II/III large subunit